MNRKTAFLFKRSVEPASVQQAFDARFFRAYIGAPAVPVSVIVPRHHLLIGENQLYQAFFLFPGSATDTGSYG